MQKMDSKPADKPLNIKVVNMLKERLDSIFHLPLIADTTPY